jgi:dienelactone hydrolase
MRVVISLLVFAAALGAASSARALDDPPAASFVRLEVHPVETVTLKNADLLTGKMDGKPTTVAAELRLANAVVDAKLPAVILIHGSGGANVSTDRWAREITGIGAAAFILESFTGRGIVNTATDQSQLDSLAMTVDAYRALALLARHPRIDPQRIAVMGFSKGAVPAVYSSNARFRALLAAEGTEFTAHIGLYTPCNVEYRRDAETTGKPIRLFHGIADSYVAIEPCRAYVERLKRAGADVALAEYADAGHAYDNPLLDPPLSSPKWQTTRHCTLREGENGTILNGKTGQPFTLEDACVEFGPQVAYNAAAHAATVAAVRSFLTTTLKLAH